MRRWRKRLEEQGHKGLLDRRRGTPSRRRHDLIVILDDATSEIYYAQLALILKPPVIAAIAGLDTFALRNPHGARQIRIYEVDHPAMQAWKLERLADAQIAVPPWLILVPVDFEREDLGEKLVAAGFQQNSPARHYRSLLCRLTSLCPNGLRRVFKTLKRVPPGWMRRGRLMNP
jgi:hypothetical protein